LIATYPSKSDLTDALTTLNTAVSDHVSDADPHTQYVDAAGVHAAFNQYGLGESALSLLDADDMVTPGTFGGPGNSGVNFPGSTRYGFLRVSGRQSNLVSQEALFSGDQYYMRYTDDGGATWTNWEQIYHTGMTPNFPDMPQVGGDPIVESGSNADGEWTRWSDGTQVVTSAIAYTDAGGFQYYVSSATFLSNVIDGGSMALNNTIGTPDRDVFPHLAFAVRSGTQAQAWGVYASDSTPSWTGDIPLKLFATGRWK
jgi:hypothetical protein